MAVKSQKELYDLFVQELQAIRADLTDTNEGSIIDVIAGVCSTAVSELSVISIEEFSKTFFDTANGPEVTAGADDLQRLAVDHFGTSFARPAASKAVGVVTFSRPTIDAGNVVIPAGTVVKTGSNAVGSSQRFETAVDVTIIGLSINASVLAMIAGSDGNVSGATITTIESALLDPTIIVTNSNACSGGAEEQSDSEYRETIRNKLEAMKGSSLSAIVARAKTVSGVVKATGIENNKPVIEYDIATSLPKVGAAFFRIPLATLYIADANGTANQALVDAVQIAITEVRAAATMIVVAAATAVQFDWTASIVLNAGGPNYSTLSQSASLIEAAMGQYINDLTIGTGFDKYAAEEAIMAQFGPLGTDDLSAFTSSVPSGDVSVSAGQKLVAQTMVIA